MTWKRIEVGKQKTADDRHVSWYLDEDATPDNGRMSRRYRVSFESIEPPDRFVASRIELREPFFYYEAGDLQALKEALDSAIQFIESRKNS